MSGYYMPTNEEEWVREGVECGLCNRLFALRNLTEHHCLPRQHGGTSKDVVLICTQCHGMVHATFTNATLAAMYPTLGQLRLAPELQPFLRWVRKQPTGRVKRNRPRRRKV